jgi:hypothetical protein
MWNMGLLGASAPIAAGSYELISTAFGTGSSGVIEFSSIPQDFKHLQVRAVYSQDDTGGIFMSMNGFGGTNYSQHRLVGHNGSVTSSANTSTSVVTISGPVAVSGTLPTAFVIDILDYSSTSKNTTIRAITGQAHGSSSNSYIQLRSAALLVTNAITTLNFGAGGVNYRTDTRFSLYGIRGE